jgi:hypothetical protein
MDSHEQIAARWNNASPAFIDDFLRGGLDCRKGNPAKQFQSSAYDAGYAAQYEIEQCRSELSLQAERLRDMRSHS